MNNKFDKEDCIIYEHFEIYEETMKKPWLDKISNHS